MSPIKPIGIKSPPELKRAEHRFIVGSALSEYSAPALGRGSALKLRQFWKEILWRSYAFHEKKVL